MQFPQSRILIFAKAPEPGRVKTRLIPALGAEEAALLYNKLLRQTVGKVAEATISPIDCWCAPDTGHPVFQNMALQYGVQLEEQVGEDLGQRMEYGATQALLSADTVILIGGDCPVLEKHHLSQAFDWLAKGADAVLGPAEDGGYVLLGFKRSDPALFYDIPWGSDQVLALTRKRLEKLGWAWRELETLWDLDRPEDLARYQG